MKRIIYLLCIGFLATDPIARALDLTPNFTNTLDDPLSPRHPFFNDGLRRYGITIDRETEVTADGGAVFRFTPLEGADFHIRFSPLTPASKFSDEDMKKYRNVALALAPSGATDVSIVAETLNSLTVNGWSSCQFDFSYKLPGREFRMSVIFLNLDDKQQLLLQVIGDAARYPAALVRSMHIMKSWHEITPAEMLPGRGT